MKPEIWTLERLEAAREALERHTTVAAALAEQGLQASARSFRDRFVRQYGHPPGDLLAKKLPKSAQKPLFDEFDLSTVEFTPATPLSLPAVTVTRAPNPAPKQNTVPRSAVFLPDAHLDPSTPPCSAWAVAKQFVRDLQPDAVLLGGDFLEVGSLSWWDRDKRRKLEGRRYHAEIKLGNRELDELQNSVPGARWWFFEGNHEARVCRYVDAQPEMEGVVDVCRDLAIERRGATWVPEGELVKLGRLHFLHGWWWNKHHALKHLQTLGDNCMYGHVHKPQIHTQELRAARTSHMAMAVGCLCDLNPDWLRGKPSSWLHGFGYVEFRPDGCFQATPINIVGGELTFGGNTWRAHG